MISNRKIGTTFEQELCCTLATYGFWAHNLAQNAAGQPFDVLAARNGVSYPIDCKVCAQDSFRLCRVEENQRLAMQLWQETGNGLGWFAVKFPDGAVCMITLNMLDQLAQSGMKSVPQYRVVRCGIPLERWLKHCM